MPKVFVTVFIYTKLTIVLYLLRKRSFNSNPMWWWGPLGGAVAPCILFHRYRILSFLISFLVLVMTRDPINQASACRGCACPMRLSEENASIRLFALPYKMFLPMAIDGLSFATDVLLLTLAFLGMAGSVARPYRVARARARFSATQIKEEFVSRARVMVGIKAVFGFVVVSCDICRLSYEVLVGWMVRVMLCERLCLHACICCHISLYRICNRLLTGSLTGGGRSVPFSARLVCLDLSQKKFPLGISTLFPTLPFAGQSPMMIASQTHVP